MQSWSPIEKSVVLLSIGLVLVPSSFLPFFAFLPSCAYWELRPYIASDDRLNQNLGFFAVGTYIKLMVYVDGGDNQISAQVLDIELDDITREANVEGEGWLAFEAPKNDYYSLYLNNTYDFWKPNDKQVLIKVYYYFYNYVILVSGVAVVALGTTLIFYYRRKSRTMRAQQ